jgi:hypothetical protein
VTVDTDSVVAAASRLDIVPRTQRWAHLSLCVLDAVFSIGARYSTTVSTCRRYAAAAGIPALVDAGSVEYPEQPLSDFVMAAQRSGVETFARDVLQNRQRTSTRHGVLKAAAALRYAEILVDSGVDRYADVPALFDDEGRLTEVSTRLRQVPGNGATDVRLGYLWMLLGDDDTIKPDRMVLRWLDGVLGRQVSPAEARSMLADAARALGCTAWSLDHAVWRAQRSRRPAIKSDSATRRRHRAHQGRWREEVLDLPAGAPTSSRTRDSTVDSMLPGDRPTQAEDAGWNLMSETAIEYARSRVPTVKAAGGVVETDRLWRNMLSSQPLAFSIVGELRAHRAASLRILSELTGRRLVGFETHGSGPWTLDGLDAEWAPPRTAHTDDGSGFDIAALARTDDGQRLLITVEVKYVDPFSRPLLDPQRYADALAAVGISAENTTAVIGSHGSQFLRSVLLTDSVRRGGRTGVAVADSALAVVLSREDDPVARDVVHDLARVQTSVPVAWWTLTSFFDAVAQELEMVEWADSMRARYVDVDHAI